MSRRVAYLLSLASWPAQSGAFLLPPRASTTLQFATSPRLSQARRPRCHPGTGRVVVTCCSANKATQDVEEVRVEDRDVPVAHRGLHDFLYGDREDHGATASDGSPEYFDGTSVHKVSEWLGENGESKHAAVYAVLGSDGAVNYVGISRNVALALKAHLANEGDLMVDSLRVRSFKYPRRDKMDALKDEWISRCGSTPVGNTPGQEWASTLKEAQASMSPAEKEAYEEGKLKMRKAMADPELVDEMEQLSSEEIERRKRLELAVEGDDWSEVIEGQTRLTEVQGHGEEVPAATIISPFDGQGNPLPANGEGDDASASAPGPLSVPDVLECNDLQFTMENVDKVLDEVRPYLVADGGNVRVMGLDEPNRVVKLALQGACGSCPSSTTTMKMGIERVLKENFRDFGGVEQIDEASGDALAEVTVAVVEAILEPLRPAMVAMRAKVEVLSALDGDVKLSFSGHRKVAYGIEMALLDNPLIRRVDFDFVE